MLRRGGADLEGKVMLAGNGAAAVRPCRTIFTHVG